MSAQRQDWKRNHANKKSAGSASGHDSSCDSRLGSNLATCVPKSDQSDFQGDSWNVENNWHLSGSAAA
ncbi:hypothetical protein BgiMline_018609 [Biomphalaria glabrata]